jgi:hypothetical protein
VASVASPEATANKLHANLTGGRVIGGQGARRRRQRRGRRPKKKQKICFGSPTRRSARARLNTQHLQGQEGPEQGLIADPVHRQTLQPGQGCAKNVAKPDMQAIREAAACST